MPGKGAICGKYLSYSGTFPPTPNCSTIKHCQQSKMLEGGQHSGFCQRPGRYDGVVDCQRRAREKNEFPAGGVGPANEPRAGLVAKVKTAATIPEMDAAETPTNEMEAGHARRPKK